MNSRQSKTLAGDIEKVVTHEAARTLGISQPLSRGEEPFMVVFDLLDITPYGRQETWEDSPEGRPLQPPYEWMRLADSY
jgi:predicted dithiol-disulfide oxidoreductase (DUF899 family)